MKRHGHIFEKIITLENLRMAHEKARKDKSFYKEVQDVDNDIEWHMKEIQRLLISREYVIKPEDYTVFKKMDKGKEREIFKLDYFPHRIIQWAIMLQTQDIFLKSFSRDTYSSIPGRGIHQAFHQLSKDLKDTDGTKYCYKMDVKKFYPSIDQNIMMNILKKKFKDEKLLWLFSLIVFSKGENKGLAIGSLASQWLGNLYLSHFDHWIKENFDIKYLYRYCDDIVLLHADKSYLHEVRKEIESYLNERLNVQIKENWQVFETRDRGIDFVGYRHFGDYVLLRKRTAKKLKRQMRHILKRCKQGRQMTYSEWCSIRSYNGWVMWCNGHNLTKKFIYPLYPYAKKYYKEVIANADLQECKK